MNYFWSNTIWYVLLGIVTIFEVIFFMVKADKRKNAFALFLTITGMAFIFELTIYAYFKSYMYYPMIIHNSGFINNLRVPDAQTAQKITRFYDGLLWWS